MALSIFSGEDRTFSVVVTAPNGTVLNLTAYTMTCVIKPHAWNADTDANAITKTSHGTPGGITFADQTTSPGSATIALAGADTLGKQGSYSLGIKLFPGAVEMLETTLVIQAPIVQTITAP